MKRNKAVRLILKDQAKEAYDELSSIVEAQKSKGKINSEEISFVLYIVDHPTYDKILGYKSR